MCAHHQLSWTAPTCNSVWGMSCKDVYLADICPRKCQLTCGIENLYCLFLFGVLWIMGGKSWESGKLLLLKVICFFWGQFWHLRKMCFFCTEILKEVENALSFLASNTFSSSVMNTWDGNTKNGPVRYFWGDFPVMFFWLCYVLQCLSNMWTNDMWYVTLPGKWRLFCS